MAANPDKELKVKDGNSSIPDLLFLNALWTSMTNGLIKKDTKQQSTVSANYLHDLLFLSPDELQTKIDSYAKENNGANLVNAQDENGQTLAHHIAANPAGLLNFETVTILLKNNPDFSIRDNEGNTPMHTITSIGYCDKDAAHMFMYFADHAAKTKFDFSSLNNEGRSVLHMAAIARYGRQKPVEYILNAVNNHNYKIDLDVLSRSGSTALYYLLNHNRFDEAKMLIEAGASLTQHGDSAADRHPYRYTSQLLRQLYDEQDERLGPMIDSFQKIKTMMEDRLKSSPDTANLVEAEEEAALQHFMESLQEDSNELELSAATNLIQDEDSSNFDEKTESPHSTTKTESSSVSQLLSSSLPKSWGAVSPDKAFKKGLTELPSDDKDNDNKPSFKI